MGEERRPPVPRATIARMVVVGAIASAIGIALGLLIDWFPTQASTQAGRIDTLWDVLVVVSVPVFVLVTVVVLYSVMAFRQRPGEEGADGPPIHGNTRLEVIWTAIPAVVLVSLCTYAYVVLVDIEDAPANAAQELRVGVTGEQFAWTFQYVLDGKKVNTTRLYLPVGRSVRLDVRSKDVIHDFWIPAMRMKVDAVPGITTTYRITPTKTGAFPAVCAELCGLGHAYMRQTAYVLPTQQFEAWARKQTAPAPAAASAAGGGGSASAAAPDGRAVFTQVASPSCASCHQLASAGSPPGIGPRLDQVLKGRDEAFIRESILNPQKEIAEGFPAGVMPANYGETLKPAELDALVQYLAEETK